MLSNSHDGKTSNLLRYLQERIPNFCIGEKMQKDLCFREILEVYFKDHSFFKSKSIGKYSLSVESIGPRSQEFFVQVLLSMSVNGHPITSKVTSSATNVLHCLEEKKYESSVINDSFCEKSVYFGNEDNEYFLKTVKKSTSDSRSKLIYIPYSSYMIVSDGCSIILMRYLAIKDFRGILCFDLITIEGDIVKCDYECSCTNIKINDANVSAFEIVQTFYVNGTISSTIRSFLTKQGRFLSIDYIHSPYIIKINSQVDHCIQHREPIILPLREEWKEDFELTSKYIYQKICQEKRKKKYLSLHLDINALLIDYIQSLLCRKPHDVIQFTMDHFKTLISTEKKVVNNA